MKICSRTFASTHVKGSPEAYRDLILKAVSSQTIVVELGSGLSPMYYSGENSTRRDKKSKITMPTSSGRIIVDQTISAAVIDKSIIGKDSEKYLSLFSHEYGHHLTRNPGYDQAIKCLGKPIKNRKIREMIVIVKEEAEAWAFGFEALEAVKYRISYQAQKRASQIVYGYCKGLLTRERPTRNLLYKRSRIRKGLACLLYCWGAVCYIRIRSGSIFRKRADW